MENSISGTIFFGPLEVPLIESRLYSSLCLWTTGKFGAHSNAVADTRRGEGRSSSPSLTSPDSSCPCPPPSDMGPMVFLGPIVVVWI